MQSSATQRATNRDKRGRARHNRHRVSAPQEEPTPTAFEAITDALQSLGWIDQTALGVLVVFFALGIFKGFIWQVSRVGILVAAYVVAGRYGQDVASLLGSAPEAGVVPAGTLQPSAAGPAVEAAAQLRSPATGETTIYLAYCLLFVVVLVALSLVTMLVKRLADKAGLSFFDRLGGGVLGVATGGCVVLFFVFVVQMFFPRGELAVAARSSHAMRLSQRMVSLLGGVVHDDLRSVLALEPLDPPQPGTSAGPQPATVRRSELSGAPKPAGASR